MTCPAILVFIIPLSLNLTSFKVDRYIYPQAVPPHMEYIVSCESDILSGTEITMLIYESFLLLDVSILAIQTRNISRTQLKDTKKTIAHVFALCLIFPACFSSSKIFASLNNPIGVWLSLFLAAFTSVWLLQLLIFFPKISAVLRSHA